MGFWVCIPSYNRVTLTLRCLSSIRRQSRAPVRTVLCDHGCTDGTGAAVRDCFPDVTVLEGTDDLWWTGAINLCLAYVLRHAADEDHALLLNDDTELPPDYIANLAGACRRFPRDVITSVLVDIRDGRLVSVGHRQSWLLATAREVDPQRDCCDAHPDLIEVSFASGRGTAYPVSVLREIGLADERRLPHYGADYDLSLRAREAGSAIYVCLGAQVHAHMEQTGLIQVRAERGLRGFLGYLFSRRSPANLKARFWFAWKHCPRLLLPAFLVVDLVRVTGSYFRAPRAAR